MWSSWSPGFTLKNNDFTGTVPVFTTTDNAFFFVITEGFVKVNVGAYAALSITGNISPGLPGTKAVTTVSLVR